MEIDLKDNLYRMRENYSKKPIRFKILPMPTWLRTTDGLYQIYKDKNTLFKYGKIYYAVLLQANVALFDPKARGDHPANFIYTTDEIGEENPEILKDTAHIIFSYKGKPSKEIPEKYRKVAEIVTAEFDRTSLEFPVTVDDKEISVKFMSVMVFRKDIPGNCIKGSVYPIIAAPDKCDSVIILPKKYWTGEFTAWKTGLS